MKWTGVRSLSCIRMMDEGERRYWDEGWGMFGNGGPASRFGPPGPGGYAPPMGTPPSLMNMPAVPAPPIFGMGPPSRMVRYSSVLLRSKHASFATELPPNRTTTSEPFNFVSLTSFHGEKFVFSLSRGSANSKMRLWFVSSFNIHFHDPYSFCFSRSYPCSL